MNRLAKIALVTLLSCMLLLLLAGAARWAFRGYTRSQIKQAELEAKVEDLQRSAHPRWRLRWRSFSITTTDRPQISKYSGDLRLVYGTNAVQYFEGFIGKATGHIVDAWVSDWTPRSEMAKFEQLSVSSFGGSSFVIAAQAHTNESVAMECTVTCIFEE